MFLITLKNKTWLKLGKPCVLCVLLFSLPRSFWRAFWAINHFLPTGNSQQIQLFQTWFRFVWFFRLKGAIFFSIDRLPYDASSVTCGFINLKNKKETSRGKERNYYKPVPAHQCIISAWNSLPHKTNTNALLYNIREETFTNSRTILIFNQKNSCQDSTTEKIYIFANFD